MADICPAPGSFVEQEVDRVLTQYRESPNLLAYIRAVLSQVEEAALAICAIPSFFDLDTAVGDQLTILGKRLGWPRCHSIRVAAPVYGIPYLPGQAAPLTIVGLCEPGTFVNCGEVGAGEMCIYDDHVYRGFLKARRYQAIGLYDEASLEAAARHVWGPQAEVLYGGQGRAVLAPMRVLTAAETLQVPLAFRALPIAPGIKGLIHYGAAPVQGIGQGWSDLCSAGVLMCAVEPFAYAA